MIIYFTGTGNSKYLAEELSKLINDELVCANEYIKKGVCPTFTSQRPFVFAGPVYSWRLARIFEDFILKSKFEGEGKESCYFVLTPGDSAGGAKKKLKDLCDEKGFGFKGMCEVVMPENYTALFTAPSDEVIKEQFGQADVLIKKLAKAIEAGRFYKSKGGSIVGKFLTNIVNPIFFKFIVKDRKFEVSDKCISCGLCEKKCPLNDIRLVDGKPTWNGRCTHCMACINYCPVEAINYGKGTVNKKRYTAEKYKDI